MSKIVLITGATSGIGQACAQEFAAAGFDLVICGRRDERLQKLAADLKVHHNIKVITLSFDIRSREEITRAMESLPAGFRCPDILINNAGLALGVSPFQDASFSHWEQMIDTNLKGLLYLSGIIAPLMVEKGSGHIINIGSIAGRDVYPGGNVYSATKAAVDSITKSMRIDLLPYGIRVSQIAPAATETEFAKVRFGGDEERAKAVYQGFEPLTAADIAEIVFFTATRPPHVNISDVLVMPAAQAGSNFIFRKKTTEQ